jgi:ubiquinone/menaquinone biosynthesis C-methylase UbiE
VRALRQQGVAAWGVDPAAALHELSAIEAHWLRAPADRLPFADRCFDVVLCAHVLEHIPEPFILRSLREIVRVCGDQLVVVIDCADPSVEGHLTIRPHQWWIAQLDAAGAAVSDDRSDERYARLICRVAPSERMPAAQLPAPSQKLPVPPAQ